MRKTKFGLTKKQFEMLEKLSTGKKVYTAESGYRRGGWKHASDDTVLYTELLKSVGRKYVIGNDAPRGGLNGKFVQCHKFDLGKVGQQIEIKMFEKAIREEERMKARETHIDTIFREQSLSGKRYFGFSKPMSEIVPEMTARINGDNLEVYINGKWKVCRS